MMPERLSYKAHGCYGYNVSIMVELYIYDLLFYSYSQIATYVSRYILHLCKYMYSSINYLLFGLKFGTNHETVLGKVRKGGRKPFVLLFFLFKVFFIVKNSESIFSNLK